MERHQEYIRMIPGATTAVLLLHGIVGTPDHFRDFIPLIPSDWSIYNMLLDGHGKNVEDFAKTSMDIWKVQISGALEELRKEHENIVIVAHSMGTLFSINFAMEDPSKIRHLFLMEAPLRVRPTYLAATTALKVLFNQVTPDDLRTKGAQAAYGIKPDKQLWKYISWIPRYLELLKEIRHTRKMVSKLETPCTAYQSRHDELVSSSSIKILQKNPQIKVRMLHESGHFHLAREDEEIILSEFQDLCNSIKS